MKTLNVLGICAGLGGLELGLRAAEPRAQTVCFIEKDEFCQQVLQTRFPGVAIWDDVTTFDPKPWVGIIDVVAAGFPCQPVSCAGLRLGINDPRWLWPWIAEIIRILGPQFVFLENVPGLLTAGLGYVLGDLAEMDFRVETGLFSCGSLGASHLRNRVAILGYAPGWEQQRRGEQPSGPVSGCEILADSQGVQCGQGRPTEGERPRGPLRSIIRVDDPDGHGDGPRLAQREEQPDPQCTSSQRGGRALWAPGPDADWSAIPRHLWPSEQPVCGVASGFPRKLEPDRRARLRALGNAYSPPVAAVAWRVLKARVMRDV